MTIIKHARWRALRVALAASMLAGGNTVMAQQAGDWVFGAGWINFTPQDSSEPLTFTSPVNRAVPGSSADVGNANTLGLSATYFLDSHWAIEGVAGIPPKFKLYGGGTLGPIGQLGDARMWSPTVLAKYYFNEGNAVFRPYAGLGLTYVWYTDVRLTPGMQNAMGGLLRAPAGATQTSARLDNKFAAVFNLGASYQLDKNWGVSFSVSYIPLKTTAKLTTTSTATGARLATAQSSLKLNPIVPFLAVTYRY